MTHDRRHQVYAARLRALGVVAGLCVAGLLVGCAGKFQVSSGQVSRRPMLPPMPEQSASFAQASSRTDTASAVIVPPVRTMTIAWDKVAVGAETEVWMTTDLRNWKLVAAVPGDRLTVELTNAQAFFKIRNRIADGGGEYIYSDWCRKQSQ